MLWPVEINHMCCNVKAAFSVINQESGASFFLSEGKDFIDLDRQVNCSVNVTDVIEAGALVDDNVMFLVHWTMSITSVSYGNPITHPISKWKSDAHIYFMNTLMSDITFVIGKEEIEIPASKAIVARYSPVLWSMLYDPLSDGSSIKLLNVSVTEFVSLMRFMCCNDVVIDKDSILMSLFVADVFAVPDVLQAIGLLLDLDTIYDVLNYAPTIDHTKDINLCPVVAQYIRNNTSHFLNSDQFFSLTAAAIGFIVGFASLSWMLYSSQSDLPFQAYSHLKRLRTYLSFTCHRLNQKSFPPNDDREQKFKQKRSHHSPKKIAFC